MTSPSSSRSAINTFLSGFLASENLRFRTEALEFESSWESSRREEEEEEEEEENEKVESTIRHFDYPTMTKTLGDFRYKVLNLQTHFRCLYLL